MVQVPPYTNQHLHMRTHLRKYKHRNLRTHLRKVPSTSSPVSGMLVTENDDSNTDKVKDEGAVKDTEEKEKQGREDGESITTAEASDGNKDEDLSPNTEASPREAILLSIGTPLKGMFTNKEAFDHVRNVALKNMKSKWKTANKDNPKTSYHPPLALVSHPTTTHTTP